MSKLFRTDAQRIPQPGDDGLKKCRKMKKFIYLMAMVCTLGFFTACSSDDDDNEKEAMIEDPDHGKSETDIIDEITGQMKLF